MIDLLIRSDDLTGFRWSARKVREVSYKVLVNNSLARHFPIIPSCLINWIQNEPLFHLIVRRAEIR